MVEDKQSEIRRVAGANTGHRLPFNIIQSPSEAERRMEWELSRRKLRVDVPFEVP